MIQALITQGEGEHLEFKNDMSVESILAYANKSGGLILLGVDNHGTVTGYKEDLDRIHDKVADTCDPMVRAENAEAIKFYLSLGFVQKYVWKEYHRKKLRRYCGCVFMTKDQKAGISVCDNSFIPDV